jgi:hypothetical protein
MSERFTVRLARLFSQALGPNPLDAVCADIPEHEAAGVRARVIRMTKGPGGPLRRLSAA